ncbi:hypothetical protein NF552_10460 [Roseomonas mucosa]|nr:hypothetical protein NF552_10460 [Roseomonas mucosa]
MNLLPALLAQLLHGGLILLVAPLLAGGARWLRLRLAGRRGRRRGRNGATCGAW